MKKVQEKSRIEDIKIKLKSKRNILTNWIEYNKSILTILAVVIILGFFCFLGCLDLEVICNTREDFAQEYLESGSIIKLFCYMFYDILDFFVWLAKKFCYISSLFAVILI